MKSILYWGKHSRIIEDSERTLHVGGKKRESLIFKKYFPKFVKELKLTPTDHSIISKVKATKRISRIITSYPCLKLRLILANKIRLTKSLYNNLPSQKLFAERVRLFSHLESITIRRRYMFSSSLSEAEEHDLVQGCKMMKYLKHLKKLEIKELPKSQKNFIEQLNSSPRLLKSLKSLKFLCHYKGPWEYISRTNTAKDLETVEILERNKAFLKHITELDIDILSSDRALKGFEGFANLCPKLLSLSLAFRCRNTYSDYFWGTRIVDSAFSVKANYLKTIETFNNLKDLHLHIDDSLIFFKSFAAPPDLKNLELRFEEQFSKEIMLEIENKYTESEGPKIFEENEIFLEFYRRFQKLKNLDSLKLLFNKNSNLNDFRCQSYFVQSMLKRTSSALKKLILNPLCSLSSLQETYNENDAKLRPKEINDPYLPKFFGSCGQFRQALQSLQIGSEKTVYSHLNLSPFHGKFPKLSSVQIFWRFKEGYEKAMEISEVLDQIIPLGDALTMIKIYSFVENKVRFLLLILRQIRQLRMPERLQVQLFIAFPGFEDLENLGVGFYGVTRELQNEKMAMGISVKLYTDIRSEGMRKFLEAYGKKFERFKCFSSQAYCHSNWQGQEDNFDY